MKMKTETKRIGGSLMVIIPKKIADAENICDGDIVDIDIRKGKQRTFGILKGIGPFVKEDKYDIHDA